MIALTGATGFVGRQILRALVERERENQGRTTKWGVDALSVSAG
jgi:uncharacterized protein YbjT (DUF2867 family)